MAPRKTKFMSYLFEKVKIDGFIVRKSTDLCLFRSKKYIIMSVSFEKVHFYVFFVKKKGNKLEDNFVIIDPNLPGMHMHNYFNLYLKHVIKEKKNSFYSSGSCLRL